MIYFTQNTLTKIIKIAYSRQAQEACGDLAIRG
jgi:hypothetical protein